MEDDWDNDDGVAPSTSRTSYSESHKKKYEFPSKREYDYDRSSRNHDHNRRSSPSRSNYYSSTFDVNKNDVGQIIGRGGSNVRDIQQKFSVNVNVDNKYYSVKVSGKKQGDIDDAISYIQKQIEPSSEENYQSSRHGGNRNDRNSSNYKSNTSSSTNYKSSSSSNFNFDEDKRNDDYTTESGLIDWSKINEVAEEARREKWAKCPKLVKNFYRECREVAALTPYEVEEIREKNNNITVARVFDDEGSTKSEPIPNPIWKFEHCFGDYPDLLEEIYKQNFKKPSPIQSQAWPILLKGEDMIGIAQTGTGKTLAFLLPAMIHTEFQPVPRGERGGPNVLILAPTRELAIQIEKEVAKYSFRGMRSVCLYGGGDRKEQIHSVSQGVEIVIATPGRLNDLVQANFINISSITYLVLDEADRMLDMGFEPQIRKILLDIRPDRQTVMTSATWPPGVRRLASSYMSNPIQVCVGTLDLAAVHTVKQIIEIMDEEEKFDNILRFVKNMGKKDKAIIFCGKKARADDLSSEFSLKGILCQCIHGSRDQSDREQAIDDIVTGYVKILIATDVASRGLDIEDITHVINYDFPHNIEEYVHRVGRTGRAGRKGTSISYVTRSDWMHAAELISILEKANQYVPDEVRRMAERFKENRERRAKEAESFGMGGRRGRGGGGGGRRNRW